MNFAEFNNRARAFRVVALRQAAIKLGLVDFLSQNPLTSAAAIAETFELNNDATIRFLNVLAHIGSLQIDNSGQISPGHFELIDLSESNAIHELAAAVSQSATVKSTEISTALQLGLAELSQSQLIIEPSLSPFYDSTSELYAVPRLLYYLNVLRPLYQPEIILNAVKHGQSQWIKFKSLNATDPFTFYNSHPELLVDLLQSLHITNKKSNEYVVDRLEFKPGERVLDLGGATGSLAGNLIERRKEITEVDIYEKESGQALIQSLAERLLPQPIRAHIHYHWGSFLDESSSRLPGLPPTSTYHKIFMGWITHDWSDETNISILKKAASYLTEKGEIVLLDWILDDQGTGPMSLNDFDMLLQTEGRERTLNQFKAMAAKAGLQVKNVITPPLSRSAITLGRSSFA